MRQLRPSDAVLPTFSSGILGSLFIRLMNPPYDVPSIQRRTTVLEERWRRLRPDMWGER